MNSFLGEVEFIEVKKDLDYFGTVVIGYDILL